MWGENQLAGLGGGGDSKERMVQELKGGAERARCRYLRHAGVQRCHLVGIDLGAIRWHLKRKDSLPSSGAVASEKSTQFDKGALPQYPGVRNEWVMSLLLAPCMAEMKGKGLQLTLEPSSMLAQQRAHGGTAHTTSKLRLLQRRDKQREGHNACWPKPLDIS